MDPNMVDDGECDLTIGPGTYEVYFVALGKLGSAATLQGWIYNVTANEYLLKDGEVTVRHSKGRDWRSGTGMFYMSAEEAEPILAALGIGWAELLAALSYSPDSTQCGSSTSSIGLQPRLLRIRVPPEAHWWL